MKKSALTALVAVGLAEISAATPAGAQGVDNFVGPYLGVHSGTATGDASFNSAAYVHPFPGSGDQAAIAGRNDKVDFDAFMLGVHGGFNFPFGSNFIGGVEADWSWLGGDVFASGSGSGTSLDNQAFQNRYRSQLDLEWQSTIRGRLGFVTGNVFLFATAGVAFLNVNWSDTSTAVRPLLANPANTLSHGKSNTLAGSVVGGGFEYAFSQTTLLGADYLYEDFGSFNRLPHGTQAGLSGTLSDLDVHKVRIRLSIRFGAP